MLLLPGDAETSLAWIPVIQDLSKDYRTFAVDHICDVGKSIYTKMITSPDEFVDWISQVIVGLHLDKVNLVGHSYGGWQLALYAVSHPESVKSLVLLSPPSILKPRPILLARAIWYYMVPLKCATRPYYYWYAPACVQKNAETRAMIDEMVEEDLMKRRCFKPRKFVMPTYLTDAQLQALESIPTLYLIGGKEVTYSAQKALRRLEKVAPTIRTAFQPNGDHHLTITHPQWVSDNVLDFLSSL